MERKYLHTLEFPKILEQLAAHAAFSASHELALSLAPATDPDEVRRRQEETAEAIFLLDLQPSITVGGARDVRPLLEDSRRGVILLPGQLLEIRGTLLSARVLRSTISRQGGEFPHLAAIADRVEDCAHVAAEISRCIDDRAEVLDSASNALARIRAALRQAHDRVLQRLERLVSSSESARYLQEALVTQRNGRYVIPLKAEFKGRIPGLIHDQSASGATLFIEPLATVELNNEWRSLQIEEENEVRRILMGLSDLVAEEADYIERTVEALAELDLAFAKAKYAAAIEATSPTLVPFRRPRGEAGETLDTHPGSTIDLKRARHPLLDPETVVPIDVHLGPDYFVVVITGPNTGGKTVSLKTAGLLTAMAQAGLAIPAAEGSSISIFDGIYADIGDEQSIEQSLSTFSSHMTKIVDILTRATSHSLVLLDELGAGTDPDEGSALAQAILSNLIGRGITTFATTHYSELKIYAHSTPGAQNASVEFDLETLSPTFELNIGLPGRSNAFAIARRLGLPADILNDAAGMISSDSLEAESLLTQIKDTQQEAVEEHRKAAATREEIDQLRGELNAKLTQIEAARRKVLEETRQQASGELETLREELAQMRSQARAAMMTLTSADVSANLRQLEGDLGQTAENWEPIDVEPAPAEPGPWIPPRVGDTVRVDSLNVTGEVSELSDDEAEVQAGSFRVRVPIRSVVVRKSAPAVLAEPVDAVRYTPAEEHPSNELDLRGLRAEEALLRLDKYLDAAALANLPWVRIIHGIGTGVLKQVVRERLANFHNTLSFRAGERGEGGDGVTVVTFIGTSIR